MSTNLKTAIIGLGNIGKVLAQNFVKSNRPIILAGRKSEDAQVLAQKLGELATVAETADAIRQANIIILSVEFNTILELLSEYEEELKGKIIIDPSNPIAEDENGGFTKIIDDRESAGEIIAQHIPCGTKLVKALGTLGVSSLKTAAFQSPERLVLFYATDNNEIHDVIEQLINDVGFDALMIGGIDQSIRIEVFGDLHEFGALGKTVSLPVAYDKINISVF